MTLDETTNYVDGITTSTLLKQKEKLNIQNAMMKSKGCRGKESERSFESTATYRLPITLLALVGITTSVLTIYSCNFFSYSKYDSDAIVMEDELQGLGYVLYYDPFEYLPQAGVGLFSYYMGDPTEKGLILNDKMCFYYCDEFTDYQWLSSNTRKNGNGTIDVWLFARYCSICAPSFGVLAVAFIVVDSICRERNSKYFRYFSVAFFWIALGLQIGTFAILFAPPIMSSTNAADQQEHFCFSESSTVQCSIDGGGFLSLTSALVYMILAVVTSTKSLLCTAKSSRKSKGFCAGDRDTDSDEDSGEESDGNKSAHPSKFNNNDGQEQQQRCTSFESC